MNSLKGKAKEIELNNKSPMYNYNISDIIAKNIFEKILSLSLTKAKQNQIEKQIPGYCFNGIKESLELAMYIDFLNYDKDDMNTQINTLLTSKAKSMENINKNTNKSFYDLKNNDESFLKKIRKKNKSEKLKKYKFTKSLDPNISNEISINLDVFKPSVKNRDKNKSRKQLKEKEEKENQSEINVNHFLLNGLIIRDNNYIINKFGNNKERIKDKNEEPFVINLPEIEQTHEHKLEFNLKFHSSNKKLINMNNAILYDLVKEGSNNWGTIEQPSAPSIDRNAGTKIKYKKPILKLKKNKDLIKDELKIKEVEEHNTIQNKRINDKKGTINKKKNENKKKLKIIRNKPEPETNIKKKKYMPIIEFPSEDLDPKMFERESDKVDLQQLRDDLEKEMAEKRLEIANRLKKEKEEQALEKALEEKRKELANKNVTVDIKGELVFIKSLDINQLTSDFTKTKSKTKEIKTIENESKIRQQKRKNTTVVEKNPEALLEAQEMERPQKKKSRMKTIRRKSFKSEDKTQASKTSGLGIFDRSKEPLIWAGSNFDLMNPSCGVNLTEEKKTKSGGKDFFHQYNKFSVEVFEETLNKTISANLYQNQITNMSNSTSTPNVMSLKKKKTIKDIMLHTNKEKDEDKKIINKTDNIVNSLLRESNDKLSVKTRNLKVALNSLDLISEGDEKYLLEKKGKRYKNIIKRKQFIMNFNKKELKDYEEINTFAKTLLGSENWGESIGKKVNLKQNFRKPQKPVFDELKRELPLNIINHIPRKRLPPINYLNKIRDNSFGKTLSEGFFNKNKKNKLKPLSTEENKNILSDNEDNKKNENKKNDYNLSTTSDFYKNSMS